MRASSSDSRERLASVIARRMSAAAVPAIAGRVTRSSRRDRITLFHPHRPSASVTAHSPRDRQAAVLQDFRKRGKCAFSERANGSTDALAAASSGSKSRQPK